MTKSIITNRDIVDEVNACTVCGVSGHKAVDEEMVERALDAIRAEFRAAMFAKVTKKDLKESCNDR